MKSKNLHIRKHNNVQYIQFPHLENTGLVHHGFSTKHGGVSTHHYSSMNLSFTRGDNPMSVKENFVLFSEAIGVEGDSLVFSDQIHETEIRRVGRADRGKGIHRSSDIISVDGLMTNEPGVTLTTFYADCVPLFFLDPINKAIGLTHAGWRGTVKGIGPITVKAMVEAFDTNPSDLLVGIAPSIGPCCYEVTGDVIMEFEKRTNRVILDKIVQRVDETHYMLDLWEANKMLLIEAGVKEENIVVTDLCTKCHHEDFYSHRVMGKDRGSLAAMMALN